MNLFQKILANRFFPYIAGLILVVIVVLTVISFLPKKDTGSGTGGGGITNLIGFSNLFNSRGSESLSLDQTYDRQLAVSAEAAAWEKKVADRFIWRKKLPLTSDKYFIYFDITAKKFVGRLYPDNDDFIEQIQAEAIRILKKEKGIPLESYVVDWDVYPRSSLAPH